MDVGGRKRREQVFETQMPEGIIKFQSTLTPLMCTILHYIKWCFQHQKAPFKTKIKTFLRRLILNIKLLRRSDPRPPI